jgi:hypothetical protein
MQSIDQLEGRATDGDPQAKFELAHQLMCGADSSHHIQQWIGLVEESSNAGHAPATELWAVFEAMGVARPQNWERAFDLLLTAAKQGSLSAQRQLVILARRDEAVPPEPDAASWSEVRASISMDALAAHGERISVSDAPRIRVIERFATPAECAWLIDRARSRLKRAIVIDYDGADKIDPGRTNTGADFLVQDMDLVLEIIRTRISAATRVPLPVFEPTQILHYEVGEEFKLHHDFLDPTNPALHEDLRQQGQRIATFLIYLNEDFEGGETEFPDVGLRLRGKTGDALFWANLDMEARPEPRSRHAGLPPTSGQKWILSQWIRDRTPASGAQNRSLG